MKTRLCWYSSFNIYFSLHSSLTNLHLFILITLGPFKINGVPLRRVNQAYVIGTSTKVDISSVNADKFDDKYFSKESQKKTKKGEGEFFEADKEVCLLSFVVLVIILGVFANLHNAFAF